MKSYNGFIKFLYAFIGSIIIFLYIALKSIKNTIGTLEINQLIWALKLNNKGVDISVVFLYLGCFTSALFTCFIYCLIVYRHNQLYKFFFGNYLKKIPVYNKITFKLYKFKFVFLYLFLGILVNFGYNTVLRVINSTDIVYYLKTNYSNSYPKYDFIKENYYLPKLKDITFKQKKNIVIILVESFETTYFNPQNPYHVKSKINLENSVSFKNLKQCSNINFTIAAITAWHFGLPLNLPFKKKNEYVVGEFLPHATSVFDILKANGYSNYFLLGSDKSFSGKTNLFKQHGDFTIKDKNYWIDKGYSIKELQGTNWGFNDMFTLQKGIEQYKELLNQDTPFALIVETVDLHYPEGWAPAEYVKYNDLRDPIAYDDEQIANFVNKFKKINDPNTVLMVLGDHNYMGISKIFDSKINRTIYNAIYNSHKNVSKEKINQSVTALDIAPTILELCGAEWNNKQFGLGISLFSDEKSLIERYDEKKFNDLIKQKSKFFDQFF